MRLRGAGLAIEDPGRGVTRARLDDAALRHTLGRASARVAVLHEGALRQEAALQGTPGRLGRAPARIAPRAELDDAPAPGGGGARR
ncbi:hypothetical protein SAMN02745121_08162 [Nannocystis exedens]|uniref:Uncharacterized protein n=1 Tax=Nannocystis exedens TaxID=54 RepID=A0A1I2HS58_9BACT|nr:hypothetical protein [Nannocystis exedens]PCC69902.1 hypothetical protein NAEX_02929 [Nannocystis exedens]SFF32562.1 hypothetical protein SAMN02745121_08162 [Nannocystis exedens]